MGKNGSHSPEPLTTLPPPPSDGSLIRLDLQTPPSLMKEVINVMTNSFSGSQTSAPEAALSWTLDSTASINNDPCNPLKSPPHIARKKAMEFIIKYGVAVCLKHGCSYALLKHGKVVGAALLTPPSARDIHTLTGYAEDYVVERIGIPSAFVEGETAVKEQALGDVMGRVHHDHADFPHWYVFAFAVDGDMQGMGLGRELFEWIVKCADTTGHPAYLETMGERNVRFYERNGFEVKEMATIEYEWEGEVKKCESDKLAVMVRQPTLGGK